MAHALTAANNRYDKLLLVTIVLVVLAIAGYFFYSLTHHSIDLFGMPNPAQNQHQQKPITGTTPSSLSQQ